VILLQAESSSVQFGHTVLAYKIRRTARSKTVSVAVVPKQGLVVTAPKRATRERLDAIVRQKGPWIVRRLKRQSDLPPPLSQREFVSGETYLYLGRQYRLKTNEVGGEPFVRLRGRHLEVDLARSSSPRRRTSEARRAVTDWYKEKAALYLPHRAESWARKLGLKLSQVLVSEPQKRWGSASKDGSLRINWRVVQAPATLVDYVLVHEVAHLLHEDHGREFWATVGRVMPDYEERKARLRELGPRLVW